MNSKHSLVVALSGCNFAPGTWTKRFVRDISSLPEEKKFSAAQEACAWRVGYIFRRQLPGTLAEDAIVRKQDHVVVLGDTNRSATCSVCKRHLTKRDFNGPCPGPPVPLKSKGTRGKPQAVIAVVAAQPTLQQDLPL